MLEDKNNKNTTEIETKFNNEPRKKNFVVKKKQNSKQQRQYDNNTEYMKFEQRCYVHWKT